MQGLFSKNKIVYVFIDASNLWEAQKVKGKFFDFQKLPGYLKTRFVADYIKCFYYTAYPAEGTRDYSLEGKHKFYTFLKKGLNFQVRKKELKRIHVTDGNGEAITEKGNMDVEITIDAIHHADKYGIAVFLLEILTFWRLLLI